MKKMNYLVLLIVSLVILGTTACTEQRADMSIDHQIHRASVDMAKAFRQFQMADNAFLNYEDESAEDHLERGLNLLQKSYDHLSELEDEINAKASAEIEKGNVELQKSIDAYSDGDDDKGAEHYNNALAYYDEALSLLD